MEGTVRDGRQRGKCGRLAGMNFGMLSGCSFHGTVSASKSVGGVVKGIIRRTGRWWDAAHPVRLRRLTAPAVYVGENKGLLGDCVSECVVNGEVGSRRWIWMAWIWEALNLTQNVVTRNDSWRNAGITSGLSQAVLTGGPVGCACGLQRGRHCRKTERKPLLNVKMKGDSGTGTWAVLPARAEYIWNPNICRTVWKAAG